MSLGTEFRRWASPVALSIALMIAGTILVGCPTPLGDGSDDGAAGQDPSTDGIVGELDGPDALALEEGAVGLVVDTRQMFRRGYRPATAEIAFDGALAGFSTNLAVDQDTSIALLELPLDDLTQDQIDAFAAGVSGSVRVLDDSGDELGRFDGDIVVDSSNLPLSISTTLPRSYPQVTIQEGTPYLIQVIDPGDTYHAQLLRLWTTPVDNDAAGIGTLYGADQYPVVLDDSFDITDSSTLDEYSFYFEPTGRGTYYLKAQLEGGAPVYLRTGLSPDGKNAGAGVYTFGEEQVFTNPFGGPDQDDWEFEVERDENGLLRIISVDSTLPLSYYDNVQTDDYDRQIAVSTTDANYAPLRAVAANIEWEVQDRGTIYNAPITPPARLDFASDSTLTNCGSGELVNTIERTTEITRSWTTETQESFELFSSSTRSLDITTSVEVGGAFKAISASASVETTQSFEYTTSTTQTTTNTFSTTDQQRDATTINTTYTLPPFTGVTISDAQATIDNVRIPFTQVLRIRGSYDGVVPLGGNEIEAQLLANLFGGVVSQVRDSYVDISIRGVVQVDDFIELQTVVEEIENPCSP
mgnify:CR=1 FL=1